jgi:tetratricopeptide (TPR) repeat protein
MDQHAKAVEVFETGILHNPGSADLYFNLGTAYDKLNRFDDVVRAMEKALQLDGAHADALNYLGYSYADRDVNIEEALALTKRAVALKPTNGYYIDSLGWAFFKKGLLKEALAEIRRAIELVGDDPVLFEHLGEIHHRLNQVTEAREAWLRSLELDPSNAKLIERYRERGLGDPTQEERVRQARQKVSQKSSTSAQSH